MDNSPEYIKMCEKAIELQNRTPQIGDYFYENGLDDTEHIQIVYDTGNNDYASLDWGTTFIPRQDQLQEIMSKWICIEAGYNPELHSEIKMAFIDFSHWLSNQYLPSKHTCVPTNCFDTGEQLWLAYAMQTKYSKKWSGENWIDA